VNAWFSEKDDFLTIEVKALPKASRSEVAGVEGDCLKVRLKAAPVDGEANGELINLLHKLLKIPRENIIIRRGATSRHKSLILKEVTVAELKKALNLP